MDLTYKPTLDYNRLLIALESGVYVIPLAEKAVLLQTMICDQSILSLIIKELYFVLQVNEQFFILHEKIMLYKELLKDQADLFLEIWELVNKKCYTLVKAYDTKKD